MAYPSIYVPAIAVAHTLGLILLVYSLEKVFGLFSRLLRRVRRRRQRPEKVTSRRVTFEPKEQNGKVHKIEEAVEEEDDSSFHEGTSDDDVTEGAPSNHDWDSSADARARAGIVAEAEPHVLTPPWIRGCSCQVNQSIAMACHSICRALAKNPCCHDKQGTVVAVQLRKQLSDRGVSVTRGPASTTTAGHPATPMPGRMRRMGMPQLPLSGTVRC